MFFDLQIDKKVKNRSHYIFALIDPDKKSNNDLSNIVSKINSSNFDAILVGGSTLSKECFIASIKQIKKLTKLKIIIFPSSSLHISEDVDAILFTTLLSSKIRKYLVGEQLKASKTIHNSNVKVVPTGYLHLDGGNLSSLQKESGQIPIDPFDHELILSYAYLSKNFGFKYIYLEAGSGAINRVPASSVQKISAHCDIQVIVGGGITAPDDIKQYCGTNVSAFVIGNLIESEISAADLTKLTEVNINAE